MEKKIFTTMAAALMSAAALAQTPAFPGAEVVVLSFVILRYSLWTNLFRIMSPSYVYRCVSRSLNYIRD